MLAGLGSLYFKWFGLRVCTGKVALEVKNPFAKASKVETLENIAKSHGSCLYEEVNKNLMFFKSIQKNTIMVKNTCFVCEFRFYFPQVS
jgi:hypothetical protein